MRSPCSQGRPAGASDAPSRGEVSLSLCLPGACMRQGATRASHALCRRLMAVLLRASYSVWDLFGARTIGAHPPQLVDNVLGPIMDTSFFPGGRAVACVSRGRAFWGRCLTFLCSALWIGGTVFWNQTSWLDGRLLRNYDLFSSEIPLSALSVVFAAAA